MKLSVVIPAHNEALVLASTVRDLAERLSAEKINHEILIINYHTTRTTPSWYFISYRLNCCQFGI